jgi:hypothetical protein
VTWPQGGPVGHLRAPPWEIFQKLLWIFTCRSPSLPPLRRALPLLTSVASRNSQLRQTPRSNSGLKATTYYLRTAVVSQHFQVTE